MRGLVRYLNRMRLGQRAVYLEYPYDLARRWGSEGNPHLTDFIDEQRATYDANLASMAAFLPKIEEMARPGQLSMDFGNHFMPVLDGLSVMWAVQRAKNLYMEIGSGYSTIYARAAAGRGADAPRIVSLDPHPRAEIDALCDEVVRQPAESVDLTLFDRLGPGDTLFVDGSHRALTNSDVTVIMLDVLPRLKPGVLVGFHDIFLPFDYPEHWKERTYNEQYMLASVLLANPGYFDLQLCNYWICSQSLHVGPLRDVWSIVGDKARDRGATAFWAIKR